MAKAIIRVDADIVAEWFVASKAKDDTKTLLKLPEHYTVEDIAMDDTGQHAVVTVDVPELPESAEPIEIEATFGKAQDEDGQWHLPESYKLLRLLAKVALPIESEVQ